MKQDDMDRGLERLLAEEQERKEIEMRAAMASARLHAGDGSVTLFEAWGDPYSRIDAIRAVKRATDLPLREAKALVDAYTWNYARTIEAAVEYSRGELAQHLALKPRMPIKDWLRLREMIESEPDLETYRCKKAQLYLYLLSRSTRYENVCKRGEGHIRPPSE